MDGELFAFGDASERVRALGHAVGVIVAAFLVGGVALPLVVAQAVDPFYPIFAGENLTVGGNLLLSVVQFVGFIGVALGYVRWRGVDLFGVAVPSLRDVGWIGGGFLLLMATAYVLAAIVTALGLETATNSVVAAGRDNPRFFLYMIPVALLFIGPGEELVFRGVVQGLFRRAYGVVPAVIVTSLLFGVAHYLALTGSGRLTYIAIATGMGLVLGSVYERTGNIVVPAVVHGLWNAMLFAGQWYVATHPELARSLTVLP